MLATNWRTSGFYKNYSTDYILFRPKTLDSVRSLTETYKLRLIFFFFEILVLLTFN